MNRFVLAFSILLSLGAAACGPDVGEDPFAACEGRGYTATIVSPGDNAKDVPTDVKVRVKYTGAVPDRYLSVTDHSGAFVTPLDVDIDAEGDYATYAFQPGMHYFVEAGWFCVIDGGASQKEYPLVASAFTTVAP
jgi:hypothetical protein